MYQILLAGIWNKPHETVRRIKNSNVHDHCVALFSRLTSGPVILSGATLQGVVQSKDPENASPTMRSHGILPV